MICNRQYKHIINQNKKDMHLADSFTSAKGVTQPKGTYNKN